MALELLLSKNMASILLQSGNLTPVLDKQDAESCLLLYRERARARARQKISNPNRFSCSAEHGIGMSCNASNKPCQPPPLIAPGKPKKPLMLKPLNAKGLPRASGTEIVMIVVAVEDVEGMGAEAANDNFII
jgi:hypothetical protein